MSDPDRLTPDVAGQVPAADATHAGALQRAPDGSTGAAGPDTRTPAASGASSPTGADLDRRRFFRQFATDVFHTAATVVGAATALQRSSVEAASAILHGGDDPAGPQSAAAPGAVDDVDPAPRTGASTAATSVGGRPSPAARVPSIPGGPAVGYHSAFRVEGELLVLIDQRRLPTTLTEVECRTAIDIASEIGVGTIGNGPAVGPIAALGLAMSANRIRSARPYARRAILRAAETTLLGARPTSRLLRAAVGRVMDRYRAEGELDEDGERITDALAAEADAIAFESNDDHGRIAEAAAVRIPRRTDRPAAVLTLGSTGAMASGQFGTAMGAVQAAVYEEREVEVFVLEGRPTADAARVTTWELAQAGIAATVVPDASVGWLLQSGRVDIVLVGAEAIAMNGDVANDVGTYPLAALASRHGIPVIVCAPLAAVDPDVADGRALETGRRPGAQLSHILGGAYGSPETRGISSILDVTPAGLISAIATEEGLLEGSFTRTIADALRRRAERLPSSFAGTALVAAPLDGQAAADPSSGDLMPADTADVAVATGPDLRASA